MRLPALEIACDESGSEGEKLIGGTTNVFAHASVHIDVGAALACIEDVRIGARSPATEVKASVVLRERNQRLLEWLIGPSGPLHGKAHVYLTEKVFHLVRKLVELMGGEHSDPTMALTLYLEAPETFGRGPWLELLESFNDLMRARSPGDATTLADALYRHVDGLRRAHAASKPGDILDLIWEARPTTGSALAYLLDRSRGVTLLDPLIPAIGAAVAYWSNGGTPVSLVHDEQRVLTPERIVQLKEQSGQVQPEYADGASQGRLAAIRLVDSESDPRVQVADFLAGAARKIASEELNGRGSERLAELLRPYVDSRSIWGDERSWSRIGQT